MNTEKELIEEITKWVKQDGIVKMSNNHGSIDRAIALSYHKTKEKLFEEIGKIMNKLVREGSGDIAYGELKQQLKKLGEGK